MHEKEIEIRWRDVDAYRHVNNAVYLTYLEEARDEWLEGVLGRDSENLWDFVLARVAIDYRSELSQEDDIVVARCGLEAIGTSSFRTKEQLLAPGGRVAAEAEAVIVARNRAAGGARALSAEERSASKRPWRADGDLAAGRREAHNGLVGLRSPPWGCRL